MANMRTADLARVAQEVTPGGRLIGAWPLSGGISADMIMLEIEGAGGRLERVVFRRQHHGDWEVRARATEVEFQLLEYLHSAGVAAPEAISYDTSGRIVPDPFLVLEFVAGEISFAPADLESYLRQAADQLAAIHRVNTGSLGFLPRAALACAELARFPPGGTTWALDGAPIWQALLIRGRPESGNPVVLLHGDFWPGNLLWRDGRLAAVVDWEDAELGDPLRDLAIARLEMAWILGLEAMERFTERYQGQMRLDYQALPYWDLCAALRLARLVGDDLERWLAFFERYGRGDIDEAGFRRDYQAFVGRALGG